MSFQDELFRCFDARFPLLYVNTIEVERVSKEIAELVKLYNESLHKVQNLPEALLDKGLTFLEWGFGHGFGPEGSIHKDYLSALKFKAASPTVFLMRHFGYAFENKGLLPILVEEIPKVYDECLRTFSYIIFIGRLLQIPQEISPYITVIDYALPTEEALEELAAEVLEREMMNPEMARACALGLKGLTAIEAEKALQVAISHSKGKDVDLEKVYAQKAELVKKSGTLEYLHNHESLKTLGGMDVLKSHYIIASRYYTDIKKAREYGLTAPRGALLVGVQGCGKSLASKVIANVFGLPLYRWDLSRVYGSLVGETEERTRETLRVIKAISPAVILIDEAEKLFAGYQSSAETSGGVVNRVLGDVLYFMEEENTEGAFFVFTSNDIDGLPPELIRAGRLDDLWFVDLPSHLERKAIFEIHLQKVGRDAKKFKTDKLAELSEGFSGADIANAVRKAMFKAYFEEKEVTFEHIANWAIKEITPFSVSHPAAIEKLRTWAQGRAKSVSSILDVQAPPIPTKRAVRRNYN